MSTWICLLRAVNLGARNKVPMDQLRKALTARGLEAVRTYLQSGNVVAESRHRSPDRVSSLVRRTVMEEFGVDTPVIVRTPAELAAAVDVNPFPRAAAYPTLLHVVFLDAAPEPQRAAMLRSAELGKDRYEVRNRELYVWYVDGAQRSRLPQALRHLGVDGTARNWRTVTGLLALVD